MRRQNADDSWTRNGSTADRFRRQQDQVLISNRGFDGPGEAAGPERNVSGADRSLDLRESRFRFFRPTANRSQEALGWLARPRPRPGLAPRGRNPG
jgi:hypothetical protein